MNSFFLAVFLLVSSVPAAESVQNCSRPEPVLGHTKYDELVCQGLNLEAAGNLRGATTAIESAAALNIFEYQNVDLFPRLARLYSASERKQLAQRNLRLARLALEVRHGFVQCDNDAYEKPPTTAADLLERGELGLRRNDELLSGEEATSIFLRMCGAIFDYDYAESPQFEKLTSDWMLREYLEAQAAYSTAFETAPKK